MIHNYKNIQIKKDEIAEPVACMWAKRVT
jgi:hypothetical protein